ncbi:MAG: hypothetical protein LBR21_03065 [Propionibacteriaceae bacterium]|nr:hypothetical protein [Propionibacteriaceae bacterium]
MKKNSNPHRTSGIGSGRRDRCFRAALPALLVAVLLAPANAGWTVGNGNGISDEHVSAAVEPSAKASPSLPTATPWPEYTPQADGVAESPSPEAEDENSQNVAIPEPSEEAVPSESPTPVPEPSASADAGLAGDKAASEETDAQQEGDSAASGDEAEKSRGDGKRCHDGDEGKEDSKGKLVWVDVNENGYTDPGDQVTLKLDIKQKSKNYIAYYEIKDDFFDKVGVPLTCEGERMESGNLVIEGWGEWASCQYGPYTITEEDALNGGINETHTVTEVFPRTRCCKDNPDKKTGTNKLPAMWVKKSSSHSGSYRPGMSWEYTVTIMNRALGDKTFNVTDDLSYVFAVADLIDGPTSSNDCAKLGFDETSKKLSISAPKQEDECTVKYSFKIRADAEKGKPVLNKISYVAPQAKSVRADEGADSRVKSSEGGAASGRSWCHPLDQGCTEGVVTTGNGICTSKPDILAVNASNGVYRFAPEYEYKQVGNVVSLSGDQAAKQYRDIAVDPDETALWLIPGNYLSTIPFNPVLEVFPEGGGTIMAKKAITGIGSHQWSGISFDRYGNLYIGAKDISTIYKVDTNEGRNPSLGGEAWAELPQGVGLAGGVVQMNNGDMLALAVANGDRSDLYRFDRQEDGTLGTPYRIGRVPAATGLARSGDKLFLTPATDNHLLVIDPPDAGSVPSDADLPVHVSSKDLPTTFRGLTGAHDGGCVGLTFEKDAIAEDTNRNGITDAGDEITFEFWLTNEMSEEADKFNIEDKLLSDRGLGYKCAMSNDDSAITDSIPVSGYYVKCVSDKYKISADEAQAGGVINSAIASAISRESGIYVQAESAAYTPAIYAKKSAVIHGSGLPLSNGDKVNIGDQIDYTITVQNNTIWSAQDVAAGKDKVHIELIDWPDKAVDDATMLSKKVEHLEGSQLVASAIGDAADFNRFEIAGDMATGTTERFTYSMKVTGKGDKVIFNVLRPTGSADSLPATCEPDDLLCTENPVAEAGTQVDLQKVNLSGDPLAGSAWTLNTDSSGSVGDLVDGHQPSEAKGEPGHQPLGNLAPGKYWLTEIDAPKGYEKLTKPISFEVAADGKVALGNVNGAAELTKSGNVWVIEVTNKPEQPKLMMPLTGGEIWPGVNICLGAGLLLGFAGIGKKLWE